MKNLKRPTYDELLTLNPLLRNKNKEEIEELINTITELGYEWDERRKYFYNKEINIRVRTQGLDIFDPNLFKETHKTWSDPNHISGMKLVHTYTPKIFILLIIDILLGWIFLPTVIWLFSLVILITSLIIVQKIAHKRVHLVDRYKTK